MSKPHVVEVRGDKVGGWWWVITNDQREWHLPRSKFRDELSAYMEVARQLEQEEQTNGHDTNV